MKTYQPPGMFSLKQIKNAVAKSNLPIELISGIDADPRHPLLWNCKKCNSSWTTKWDRIHFIIFKSKYNGWGCNNCSTDNSEYLKEIKEITAEYGIEPTNEVKYKKSTQLIQWKCFKRGHIFMATWDKLRVLIKRKTKNDLCRCCANRYLSVENIQVELDLNNRGLKVLSTKVKNVKDKLSIECQCGNLFQSCWDVLQRSGCAQCAGRKKFTIEDIAVFVKDKLPSATLLSFEYIDCKTPLDLKCNVCNTVWHPNFDNLKNSGQGCPTCNRNIYTDARLESLFDEKGYVLMSIESVGDLSEVRLSCKICSKITKKIVQSVIPVATRSELKCDYCEDSIKVQKLVEEVKALNLPFICLDPNIIGKNNRLKWQCTVCSSIIERTDLFIKEGRNPCEKCYKDNMIKEIRAFILKNQRPFSLVSDNYDNLSDTKLIWHCHVCDLQFCSTWRIVRDGSGCVYCNRAGIKEKEILQFLNNVFDNHFLRIRPNWLVNTKTNCLMEIDCYSESLNLAIEVNGAQHYFFVKRFHRIYENFEKMKERDILKRNIIEQRNINFIEINFLMFDTVPELQDWLYGELIRLGYKIDEDKWKSLLILKSSTNMNHRSRFKYNGEKKIKNK